MKARAFAVALGITLLAPILVSAQPWTAAGITAVVPPEYRDDYSLQIGNPSYITFADATEAIQFKILFNVTDTSGTGTPLWNTLEMGVQDSLSNSYVRSTLYRVDKCTGKTTALCTVTSQNSSSPTCWQCTFSTPIDFFNNSYFIQVEFLRSHGWDLRLYSLRVY